MTGLTTAATMWVVAAIGMTIGAGAYVEAVGATGLVLAVLIPLRAMDRWSDGLRDRMDEGRAPTEGGEQ